MSYFHGCFINNAQIFFFLLAEPICIGFRMWKSYSNSLNATTMKNFYKFLLVCLDNLFLLKTENTIAVGPKNLVTPAHFILIPRPTPKRKKCPRTNEEGSNCQVLDNPVLGKSRSRKEKVAHCQRQPPRVFQGKAQVQ